MKQKLLQQMDRSIKRLGVGFITTALFVSSMVLPNTAHAAAVTKTHDNAAPTLYWLGEYFNNATLSGAPVFRRNTRSIAFNWGVGSPNRSIARDNFSVRWTRTFNLPSGTYRFRTVSDDGVRVWVDNTPVIDAWTDGPARVQEADVTLSGLRTVRVEYYERSNVAAIRLTIGLVSVAPPGAPSSSDWRAEYFNNLTLEGSPSLVRQDAAINFDWGTGSPNPQVIADGFSARWTRKLNGVIPGYYNIGLRIDDGARVFVDGNLVVNEWRDGAARNVGANVYLTDGSTMRVEYYDRNGGALIQLSIFPASAPAPAPTATAAPTAAATTATYPDWRGEYYNNPDLTDSPILVRNDTSVNFDWGTGSPDGRVSSDNFSARWTRRQNFGGGVYRIEVTMDDGMRVFVDGNLVLNEWRDASARTRTVDVAIGAGDHDLRVEYYERGFSAVAKFSITRAPVTATPTATPVQTPVPTVTPIQVPALSPTPTLTPIP